MKRGLALAAAGAVLAGTALLLTGQPGLHAVLLVVGLGLIAAPGRALLDRAEAEQRPALRVVAAALPAVVFAAPLLSHLADAGPSATGFIWVDFTGYAAHAREIFDRGNGVAYANGYDPDPSSPAIYVFWYYWLISALMTSTGADPAVVILGLGAFAALALSRLTLALASVRVTTLEDRFAGHLILLWGGGLLVGGGFLRSLVMGAPGEHLLHFDPTNGYWFLNWGRNLVYPTETVLHAVVAGLWLAMLTGRRRAALVCVLLLCTTHFHTGLAHGTVFVLAMLLEAREDGARVLWAGAGALIVGAQAAYGMIYLPSFEAAAIILDAHADTGWIVPAVTQLLAYGPVAVFAFLARRDGPLAERRFLLAALIVGLALINHELFMQDHQPVHFTRGYVWLPLALLGLPRMLALYRGRTSWKASPALSGVFLVGLLCLDNGVFLIEASRHIANDQGLDPRLHPNERAFYAELDKRGLKGIVLLPSDRLALQLPAYTDLTGWHGQYHWTPNFDERARRVHRHFMAARDNELLQHVDWVLIPADLGFEVSVPEHWPLELHAHGHKLYRHPR
jgi:hypothetical protein